jgi:catalase
MLLGRLFSYHDTHLHRIGPNAAEIPVNRPHASVHSYNRDGAMRHENPADPTYAPNSVGGLAADPARFGADPSWPVAGEIVRVAYEAHPDDDDFVQANTMVNDVFDADARACLVSNVVGRVCQGVEAPLLSRVRLLDPRRQGARRAYRERRAQLTPRTPTNENR